MGRLLLQMHACRIAQLGLQLQAAANAASERELTLLNETSTLEGRLADAETHHARADLLQEQLETCVAGHR